MRNMSEDQLARLLRGWDIPAGRKSDLLSSMMIELSQTQELPFGSRLPAERALATALGVSRSTVSEAYSHLREQGYLESVRGSGSRLRRPGPEYAIDVVADQNELRMQTFFDRDEHLLDLTTGALPGLPLVTEVIAELGRDDDTARLVIGHGYDPQGLHTLRERIAARYTEQGTPTDPECIVVTSGSQQALEMLCRMWIDPGETVMAEDPSYRGALTAFRDHGARILTLPRDVDGPDVGALDRMTRRISPRFVYLLPTVHNPTGSTLPEARRAEIRRIANDRRIILVEDTSTADLLLDSAQPLPLLAGLDPDIAIGVGSLSKLFWGGLRIGWIRAPRSVVARLRLAKSAMDLGSSLVSQLVAVKLFDRLDEALEARRLQLATRLAAAEGLLEVHLPAWTWARPSGGGALWIRVPGDAVEMARTARRSGIAILPGPMFSAVEGYRNYLRLPFAGLDAMEDAIPRLSMLDHS